MAHDDLDIIPDTDPREAVEWWLAVAGAAIAAVATGWWAPRTWWTALTAHEGHGLAVARAPRSHRRRPRGLVA